MINKFEHLKTRKKDQIINLKKDQPQAFHILTSSSDLGVSLNGGRLGSRFAPKAILSQFTKLHAHKDIAWSSHEVAHQKSEEKDFHQAQTIETDKVAHQLEKKQSCLIHLGGGHDHIYPLLKALAETTSDEVIHVINLDAHLDTRKDLNPHSGTPFRQISTELKKRFRLTQIGIHSFANHKENYNDMENMTVHCLNELQKAIEQNTLSQMIDIHSNEITVLSLDCDALDSTIMSAVSAPNHKGISAAQLDCILTSYKQQCSKPIIGIYEYNPLYEDLSCKGARFLAHLLYQFYNQNNETT